MYLLHRNYVVKHLNEDTVVLPQWENEKMKFTEDWSMNMKKMKTSHLKIQNIIRVAINISKVSTTYHLLFCLYNDFVLHDCTNSTDQSLLIYQRGQKIYNSF